MDINFENLFNEVEVLEGTEVMLNRDELPGELLELIRDAKLAGLTGYDLIELAILEYEAERKAANPVPEVEETPDLNVELAIPTSAPVAGEPEEQDETLAEYEERIAREIAVDNGFPPDHVVSEELAASRDAEFDPENSDPQPGETLPGYEEALESGSITELSGKKGKGK